MSQQPPPAPVPASLSPTDIQTMVANFLAQGQTEQRVGVLMNENWQYREKNRILTAEVEALKLKTPGEGTQVLTADEKKIYDAFIALKLKPEEIVALQAKTTKLEGEVVAAQRKAAIEAAATAEGYDSTVLTSLVGDKELVVKKVEEGEGNDKKQVDRAFILTMGANNVATEERLSAHVTTNHAKFLPALVAEAAEGTNTGKTGTSFPRQRATAGKIGGGKADASQAYLDRKYKSPPAAQGAASK